jgi:hypothetical protein
VVVAAHIPFFDPKPGVETFRRADRERLFALLAPFPRVLLLTAHGHVQRQYRHGPADGWHGAKPLPEFNAGAACGAYWSGRPDAAGIPDATMADGTPNGYARLRIAAGAEPVLSWHAARGAGDPGLALHAPKVLRRGAYPAFGVFANVWLGDADTTVEFRVDDGPWKPMAKVERGDPALQVENAQDDLATTWRGVDRSAVAARSPRGWRGLMEGTSSDLDLLHASLKSSICVVHESVLRAAAGRVGRPGCPLPNYPDDVRRTRANVCFAGQIRCF